MLYMSCFSRPVSLKRLKPITSAKDKSMETGAPTHELYGILDVVLGFSPEERAKSKSEIFQKDWMLLMNEYKSVVA
jgi:hypothetical protein